MLGKFYNKLKVKILERKRNKIIQTSELSETGKYFLNYLEKIVNGTFQESDYNDWYEQDLEKMIADLESKVDRAFLCDDEDEISESERRLRGAQVAYNVLKSVDVGKVIF